MLFSSYAFILIFLPLFLLAWQACAMLDAKRLPYLLLGVSLFFYALWGLPFLILLLALVSLNWIFGQALAEWPQKRAFLPAKGLFVLGVLFNLLPLLWFKYSWFVIANLALLFGWHLEFAPPGLPLGISFYTFIQLAWLCGVYKRQYEPEGYLRHLLFSACFFYVISGPIVRAEGLVPQFGALRAASGESVVRGLWLFIMGLSKKAILADSIAVYANAVFGAAEKGLPLTTLEAWLGSFAYTFQLYFDFSGYTDMALGLALMVGIALPANFNSPYKSTGIVDFWRRWHMTLGLWLRDFLYIPLGGNRKGRPGQYLNLFLTMLIGGAWHGAGWTYIIWGGLHGAMLAVNHFYRAITKDTILEAIGRLWVIRAFSILLTFVCLNLCWVIFRAPDLACALAVYQPMFRLVSIPDYWPLSSAHGLARFFGTWLPNGYFDPGGLLLIAFCLFVVWFLPNSNQIMDDRQKWFAFRPSRAFACAMALTLFGSLLMLGRETVFLYFQF